MSFDEGIPELVDRGLALNPEEAIACEEQDHCRARRHSATGAFQVISQVDVNSDRWPLWIVWA